MADSDLPVIIFESIICSANVGGKQSINFLRAALARYEFHFYDQHLTNVSIDEQGTLKN